MVSDKISIIGGGIGGIYLAWKLAKEGYNVTLLEKQKFLGGLATSIKFNNYFMDIGPHFVTLNRNSQITKEIFELLGKEKIFELPEIKNWYKSYFKGKIIDGRPTVRDAVFSDGIKSIIPSLFSIAESLLYNKEDKENPKDYLISLYGHYFYNNWCKPFLIQTLGTYNPSLDFVKKKFKPIQLKKILMVKNKIKTFETSHNNKPSENIRCYFKYGMGTLVDGLVDGIKKNGGRILTNANVISVTHDKDLKKIRFSDGKTNQEIESNFVVYATPLQITKNWFPKLKENQNTENTFFLNSILVFLLIDSSQIYNGWILGIFDSKIPFFRIAQQSYLSKDVAPPGRSLLSLEIRSQDNDSVWTKNDEEIFNLVKKSLKKIDLFNIDMIEGYKILKLKNVYPITNDNNDHNSLLNYISSLQNEYAFATLADGGALVGGDQSFDNEETPTGGIHHALLTGNKIFNEIIEKKV